MATAPKPKLESLPQMQVGVSERGNIRMKKLAAPRCPIQSNPEKPGYTGDIFPETMSCQQETKNYPGWWDLCANRGHDPYFTTKRKVVKEELTDENGIVTGVQKRVITTKKLNINQVPIGTRFASGRNETISKGLKGRKELSEFGYNPLCEYRNCELDVKVKSKYGNFCTDRHARLIGADVEGIMLHNDVGEKNKQLRKEVDPEFEGSVVIQSPPALS